MGVGRWIFVSACAICMLSCSTTRVLQDGEFRLASNRITVINDKEFNTGQIEPYLKLVQAEALEELDLDDEINIGYTLKTMAAGLWCVYHAPSFEEGLLAVVNEGGDADTNGAVAGSLLGAKYGYDAIPPRYIKGLKHKDVLWRIIRKKECFQR